MLVEQLVHQYIEVVTQILRIVYGYKHFMPICFYAKHVQSLMVDDR